MIRYELKKAFANPFFILAMAVGLFISIANAVITISKILHFYSLDQQFHVTAQGVSEFAVNYSTETLYTYWIGGNGHEMFMYVFYYMIFLLCVIPFAWSLASERKSGYIKNIIVGTNRNKYYIAKYISVFVSGGSIAGTCLITNLLICACVFPAYIPDQLSELYYGIPQQWIFSDIFYSNPLLYVGIFILLSVIFTGLWATVALSLSFFLKKVLVVLICPYMFLLFVQVISDSKILDNGSAMCISPMFLIYPRLNIEGGYTFMVVIIIWLAAMLSFDLITLLVKGRKKDVI